MMRGRKIYEPPRFMSTQVAADQLLQVFNGDCDIYLERLISLAKLDKAVGTVRRQLVLDHILLNLRHKYN